MHPLVRNTIAEVKRRGHEITLEAHLPAIMQLEREACASDRGDLQDEIDWLDRPVVLGHRHPVSLYPLSFAGKLWIEEIEQRGWFEDDPATESLAIAWTLANSRSPAAFAQVLSGERHIRRMLRDWAKGIDCPIKVLLLATRKIMMPGGDIPVDAATKKAASKEAGNGYVGQSLARLVHEFGGTFNDWLYGPWRDVDAALALLRKDSAAMSKALGKGDARDPGDPSVLAFARWRKAQQAFLDSFAAAATGQEETP